MRKLLILISCIYFCTFLIACNSGNTKNVEVIIGISNKFSETEIEGAVSVVKLKFKEFKGFNLAKIWYDEDKSVKYLEFEVENSIVLFSNFNTGKHALEEGLNPNSSYTNWMWILKREGNSKEWEVIDWGY